VDIYNPNCTRCELHTTRTQVVRGKGDLSSNILGLGEAPGGEEDKAGVCFVGTAGKQLDEMLKYVGLSYGEWAPANMYIDNPIKCRPIIQGMGGRIKNGKPTAKQIQACDYFLCNLLNSMAPKLIICFGAIASDIIWNKRHAETGIQIYWERGKLFQWRNHKVLPLYHPAFFIYNPDKASDTWKHLNDNRTAIYKAIAGEDISG